MTHTVGRQQRNEIILDPSEALRRGAVLDRMLPTLLPPQSRGVMRAPHRVFNEIDDDRRLQVAQPLNRAGDP